MYKKLLLLIYGVFSVHSSCYSMLTVKKKKSKISVIKKLEKIDKQEWNNILKIVLYDDYITQGVFNDSFHKSLKIYMDNNLFKCCGKELAGILKNLSQEENCLHLMRCLRKQGLSIKYIRQFVFIFLALYDYSQYIYLKKLWKSFKEVDQKAFLKLLDDIKNPFLLIDFDSKNIETMLLSVRIKMFKNKKMHHAFAPIFTRLYKIGLKNEGYLYYSALNGVTLFWDEENPIEILTEKITKIQLVDSGSDDYKSDE